MKSKTIALVSGGVLAAVAIIVLVRRGHAQGESYRFVQVERGDVASTVSATGTLSALRTVQVGTQVSGQIAALYADYNDRVHKGELIARLDPTLLQQAVAQAEAGEESARANRDKAKFTLDQSKPLYQNHSLTESDYRTALYSYQAADAAYKSAQASLEHARQNLKYADIYSPIDGIVIERNVDVGQTVAASFSAPQLFLIAKDLSKMQILASVDESDIGQIHVGQPVTFTVQAYPNQSFSGTVQQVRLESTTVENVVDYTVVIDVSNPDGKLLPGMTATAEFLVANAPGVLEVPDAALRFRATPDMIAQLQDRLQEHLPDSTRQRVQGALRIAEFQQRSAAGNGFGPGGPGGAAEGTPPAQLGGRGRGGSSGPGPGGRSGSGGRDTPGGGGRRGPGSAGFGRDARAMVLLWYLDDQGQLWATPTHTGITNGQVTEVSGPALHAGMDVIAAVVSSGQARATTNPFQNNSRRRFRFGF